MHEGLDEAYIIALLIAETHVTRSKPEGYSAWDIGGISNAFFASKYPASFELVMTMGVSGFGNHLFRIELINNDGVIQLKLPPDEDFPLDFGPKGSMWWMGQGATLNVDGEGDFELIAYLNDRVASVAPIFFRLLPEE